MCILLYTLTSFQIPNPKRQFTSKAFFEITIIYNSIYNGVVFSDCEAGKLVKHAPVCSMIYMNNNTTMF